MRAIHPESKHYGHRVLYGEYGWTWHNVVDFEQDEEELTVRYESDLEDADIVESALVCATCDHREVSAADLYPGTEYWYGEFAEDSTDN